MSARHTADERSPGGIHAHLDLTRLQNNIGRFHQRVAERGVRVRCHVKGHRTVQIAQRQLAAGATGIAVTQLAQARRYIAAGITDVVVAHPWTDPWRWRLIAELADRARLSAHVTTEEAVRGLGAAATAAGTTVGVRLQLGTGEDVTAVPDGQLLVVAAAVAAEPALRFDGVTAYQGLLTAEQARRRVSIGRATARYAIRIAGEIRRAGLPCPGAVGGTPTAEGSLEVPGVTEVCAGACALQDAGLAALGICTPEDIALHVAFDDPATADAALSGYPYPWQSWADSHPVSPETAPGTRVVPPHVCALLPHLERITAYDALGGRPLGTWETLNAQGTPPGRRRPAAGS
ncbi:alanine racemase [Streptomyces sp. NPDC001093]|uniref:alanine racemase n=1 Tax=Streptomyces sp. NPDC001093 TaxID=3154376 RepID=UPI00331DCE4F